MPENLNPRRFQRSEETLMKRILGIVTLFVIVLTGCSTIVHPNSSNTPSSQNKVNSSTVSEKTVPSSSQTEIDKFPDWFLQDLQMASSVHFPISASTYALNWNTFWGANMPVNIEGNKNIDVFEVTKKVWMAGYTGNKSESGYSYYWGTFDMKAFYERAKNSPQSLLPSPLTPIYMLGSDSGVGVLVPAISIELGNGGFLAFAPNQVITKSDHAGEDQYVVYPVQGIKIPSES